MKKHHSMSMAIGLTLLLFITGCTGAVAKKSKDGADRALLIGVSEYANLPRVPGASQPAVPLASRPGTGPRSMRHSPSCGLSSATARLACS